MSTILSPAADGDTVGGVVTVTADLGEPATQKTLFTYEAGNWRSHGNVAVSPANQVVSVDWDSTKDYLGNPLPDGSTIRLRMNGRSQATGTNIPYAPIRSVVTKQGPTGPTAALALKQIMGTRVLIDASGSVGATTYAAEVDGVPLSMSGPQATVALKLGNHHFKVTVTDANGATATAEQDFVSVWQGWDDDAQCHARASAGDSSPGVWTAPIIDPEAHWDTLAAVADPGAPRLTLTPRGASYELRYGDHPQPGGGDRIISAITPTMEHPDWQGREIDIVGNDDGLPRFMRWRFRFPLNDRLDHFNTVCEARADSEAIFTIIPQGTKWTCYGRANRFLKSYALVKNQWEDLVWEWLFSPVSTVGYVRLYKDGAVVTNGVASADGYVDPDGRVFFATKPAATSRVLVAAKFYRSNAYGDLGPVFIDFEDVQIALTYEDAMRAA